MLAEYIPQLQEHLWSMHSVVESVRAESRQLAQKDFAKRKGLNRRPPREIKLGDWVLHMRYGGKMRNKLMSYWAGPKQVIEKLHDHLFKVEDLEDEVLEAHDSYLKFYMDKERGEKVDRKAWLSQYKFQNSLHVPERILSHRDVDDVVSFQVKWAGVDEVTWEPAHRFMKDVPRMVKEYLRFQDADQRQRFYQMIA